MEERAEPTSSDPRASAPKPDTHEDGGTQSSRDDGRYTPGGSNLRDTLRLPSPVNREIRRDGNTDESAENRLGGGDGETEVSADGKSDREVYKTSATKRYSSPAMRHINFCHHHGHNQNSGRAEEAVDGEDTTADGRGDLLSKGNGADGFRNGCKDTGLDQGQRSRPDRRRVRVGHIL